MATTDDFVRREDSVIISDMLYFIVNRLDTHPMDEIVKICNGFYDDKTVFEEKTKFFNAISEKYSGRKTDNKVNHEVRV